MSKHDAYNWDPERLNVLVKAAGISRERLAKNIGVSVATVHAWMAKGMTPGMSGLIAVADYFAVPLDYLIGRCSQEEVEAIQRDYASNFMRLRRAPYEAYIRTRRSLAEFDDQYEAPWPYNLVEDVLGEPVTYILTKDNENGIEYVLGCIPKRESNIILQYYHDGKSINDIAREYGVTRARVYQILDKAMRRMKTPSFKRCITDGKFLSEMENDITKRCSELEKIAKELDSIEKTIQIRQEWADKKKGEAPFFSLDTPLDELGLSVRSYNCLSRASAHTLSQVMDIAKEGRLSKIRNLGRKSQKEILNMIETTTGIDYASVNIA